MAKNRPEKICVIKQIPNNEPKFHIALRVDGDGKETNALPTIDKIGCVDKVDSLCVAVRVVI